ncbi:MAG: hypothetical protein KDA91_16780 [Planctomycetaceae bacterium]|nr:hypothetical protein [Planctomycetaceae bacterium]
MQSTQLSNVTLQAECPEDHAKTAESARRQQSDHLCRVNVPTVWQDFAIGPQVRFLNDRLRISVPTEFQVYDSRQDWVDSGPAKLIVGSPVEERNGSSRRPYDTTVYSRPACLCRFSTDSSLRN